MTNAIPAAGLRDPVHDAQRCFRLALDAMARPGTIHTVDEGDGLPLPAALAQLLLTLTDEDTPVWWQSPSRTLPEWLRFHTGARSAADSSAASFAVVTAAADLPALADFRCGTPESPEHSCTLLIELPSLREGAALQAHGPGIPEFATLRLAGLPEGFWAQWQANHARFPQGVDIFFTCGRELLALPRSTRVGRLQEV